MKNMRNNITLILLSLLFTTFFAGCFLFPPTNHAPTITSIKVTTATVGVVYTYDVEATDPDGDTLTYSLTTKPTGMTITSTTGLINWIPTSTGDYDVMVEVSDNGSPAESITQSFTIHVEEEPEPTNHAPTITSTPITSATVCQAYSYNVDATDPDGDTLTYSLSTKPIGMTINSSTGLISWTPTATGDYDVTVRVSDGEKTVTQSFTVSVHIGICGEVLQTHDLAEQKLNDIVEGPDIDIENALTILGEYLNEQTGVESTVIDDNLLQINYESGLISFILLQDINTEPTFGGNIVQENTLFTPFFYFPSAATNVLEVKSDLNNSNIQITKDLDDIIYTGNRDVLIWAPFAAEYNTWGCEQWSCDVISEFDNRFENSTLNFTITTLENEEADVAALQNITDYGGMVIFITHGGKKGKWLITGEVVDTSWYLGGYNPYYEGWLLAKHMAVWQDMKVKEEGGVLVLKPVYAVNSSWFNSNLSGNFSNTIILNISCYSAKTDDLWNVFKDKSAGAYFGFTDKTSGGFGLTQGWDLVEKLREGVLTTGEAYQPEFDPYYPSLWVLRGNFNLKFPKDTVSSIEVLPETMSLVEGDSQSIDSITAHYNNGDTTNIAFDDCTYDSSNPGVAIVNTGVITAVAPGTATITVSYTEGGITKTDTVAVTVNALEVNNYEINWSTAESNGWENPLGEGEELITSTSYDYNSDIYLQKRGKRHVGVDIHAQDETNVYAIADGTVVHKYTENSWYDDNGNLQNHSVIIIKHTNSENGNLFAIYGHVLAKDELESTVKAGEKIGVVKKSGSPCHLHFGINTSSKINDFYYGIYGWGRVPADANPSDYGWVDPIDYLNAHSIENIILNSITVSPSTMSLIEGDSQTISSITAHYSDGGTADIALDDCAYSTNDPGVATVDTGVITAVDEGTATITVSYTEGGITKTDTVEVTVTSVTPKTYTITASAGPNGSINPSGDVTVNEGSDKSFTITPDTGYQIDDVLVDGSSIGAVNSYTFNNVTQDHTISATFSAAATGPVHNLTKDTYYDTIQAALDDADSLGVDTIEVDDGTYNESITFPANKVVTLQSASGIRDNVIIQGANNFATVTTNVSSTGTTLRGFTVTHTGGNTGRGIYIGSGNLIVDNCIISGNTTADHGGGIYNVSGTLTITSSTISDNTATYSGGGIDNNDGTIDITSSTIYSNTTTTDQGGGIHNDGTLDITSSDISDNTATRGGGINNYGTLTITSSIISGNTAANNKGGGIYSSVTLTITGSTISGNTAAVDGGGIHNCGTLTITGSTISGNTSGRYGGGIGNDNGTLTITSSTISDNTADDVGGGIGSFSGTLTITGSNISGNNVSQQGGGIYLGGTGTIIIGGESPADKNTICGNYKTGEDPSLDQQIRGDSGDLYETYKNTNYISAYCGVPSGSVHNLTKDTYYDTIQAALDDADSGDTIEVSDGTYDESIIFPSGKVIILQSVNGASSTTIRGNNSSSTVTFDGSLEDTTLEGFTITHADGESGRGIYIIHSNLSIENCAISGNNANGGGGICNWGSILTITGSIISGNYARAQHSNAFGGGIYNVFGGTLIINESDISDNYASGGGGYTYYGGSGGGIKNGGTLTITGSTISGNYAGGEGGASGGGISSGGTLTITGSTISDNYAQCYYGASGGGISSGGTLTITGSTISDNYGSDDGGIYLGSSGTFTIGGSSDTDKNIICGNYKTGEDPSLDQQIRDDTGSLYETYKDTNYISAYCE